MLFVVQKQRTHYAQYNTCQVYFRSFLYSVSISAVTCIRWSCFCTSGQSCPSSNSSTSLSYSGTPQTMETSARQRAVRHNKKARIVEVAIAIVCCKFAWDRLNAALTWALNVGLQSFSYRQLNPRKAWRILSWFIIRAASITGSLLISFRKLQAKYSYRK